MKSAQKSKIQVYYNSACPVCSTGIDWQKNKKSDCEILWKNIHTDNRLVDEINEELKVVRKYLHLTDNDRLYIGFEAFIRLWENSPTEVWKAKVFSLPVIKHVSISAYYVFANVLYFWNKLGKKW